MGNYKEVFRSVFYDVLEFQDSQYFKKLRISKIKII